MKMRRAHGRLGATAVASLLIAGAVSALPAGCDSTAGGDASIPDSTTAQTETGPGPDIGGDNDASGVGSDGGDGATDADAASCTQDLSNVGKGDFRIAFRIQTTATAQSAVLSQRGSCSAGIYWSIRMGNGHLGVETDNNTERPGGYYVLTGIKAVNDGTPHDVVVTRTSGMLAIRVDGVLDPTDAPATSTSTLGSLSTVRIGTDVCVGVDGTVALTGTVTNVCVGP
jgi:hypothetical protein